MTPVADREIHRRSLLYVPIIHTHIDLGEIGTRLKRAILHKDGLRGWQRKAKVLNESWTQIERTVLGRELPYARLRVYQDGLPVCGREEGIVRDLARSGSRNHQLLLRLMERGATIMGTESVSLLIKEYALAKEETSKEEGLEEKTQGQEEDSVRTDLLEQRDTFIANRINETLEEGETGILFVGMLHSIVNHLDEDILVSYPLQRPHWRHCMHLKGRYKTIGIKEK